MQEDDTTKEATSDDSAAGQIHPTYYEVRVKGRLDARWGNVFDGLHLTNEIDGTTIIHGPIVDQAALHGLLQKLRDLALPLVSVAQVEPDLSGTPTHEPR